VKRETMHILPRAQGTVAYCRISPSRHVSKEMQKNLRPEDGG